MKRLMDMYLGWVVMMYKDKKELKFAKIREKERKLVSPRVRKLTSLVISLRISHSPGAPLI